MPPDPVAAPSRRITLGGVLRVLVSVAFLLVALRGTGLGDVARELGGARPGWVLVAIAALAVSYVIGAERWHGLVAGLDVPLTRADAARFSWIGLFFTNALPSGFGGDAVRAFMVGRRTNAVGALSASVLVDRLTAVWALVGLGLVGLVASPQTIPSEVRASMIAGAAAVALGSAFLLARTPLRLLSRLDRPAVAGRAARSIDAALATYRDRPRLLARAFVLSVGAQACVAIETWALARALGIDAGMLLLASVVPVALLATAVPTSINGLGVRETVFRALLVPAGVAADGAVALSLATVAVGAIVSLPGAVLWLATRRDRS